jgi:hypothetical protein
VVSKRLQVVLDDKEMREIERAARQRDMSVSEWVRQSLRAARLAEPSLTATKKIQVVRAAVAHSFPTADVDRMLDEIASGYGSLP